MRRSRDSHPAKGEIRPLYRDRPLAVRSADRLVGGDGPAVERQRHQSSPRPPSAADQQMAGPLTVIYSSWPDLIRPSTSSGLLWRVDPRVKPGDDVFELGSADQTDRVFSRIVTNSS